MNTDTYLKLMKLKHVMLRERSQTRKATYCMIPLMLSIQKRQIIESRLWINKDWKGLGEHATGFFLV